MGRNMAFNIPQEGQDPAQDIPQEDLPSLINVFNPKGELVSIPQDKIRSATAAGYRPAAPEEVHQYFNEQKYGGLGQQVKAGLEGVLRGTTFGLGTGIETGLGIAKPEDIRGREEANPIASQVGEIAGLAGSAFIPVVGEAGLLEKAGSYGAEAAGFGAHAAALKAAEGAAKAGLGANEAAQIGKEAFNQFGALSKVGSYTVKGAVENAMVQGGDEISKAFAQDPNQSAETAVMDMGLSGLMGGALGAGFGAISPLWNETVGKKFGGFLDAIKRRSNGEAVGLPKDIAGAIDSTGIEVAPEIRSVLSGDPELQNQWHKLQESSTSPGIKMQEAVRDFKNSATDSLLGALGHTPESLPLPSEISEHQVGTQIINKLSDSIEKRFKPISEGFNEISEKLGDIPLRQQDDVIADKLAQVANENKWSMFEDSDEHKLFNTAMKGIPNIKSLEDLRLAQSKIGKMGRAMGLWDQSRKIVGVLRDLESTVMDREAGASGADTLMKLQLARSSYKTEIDTLDALAEQLKLKNYGGAGTFVKELRDSRPESILKKLNPSDNAGLIEFLQKEHPEVAQMVKDYHINNTLANATLRAGKNETINSKKLFTTLDSMSPEMKDFLFQKTTQDKVSAVRTLMDAIPEHKSSFTAKNLDSIWSKIPGGASAVLSMMTGHSPVAGYIIGQSAKWLSRDAPDAIRLAFLKFLGHEGPVEPAAFKSMVDFISHQIKGETSLNRSIKNLFKAGSEVLPRNELPDESDHKKLDKQLQRLNQDSSSLMNTGGKTAYYLPDHNGVLAGVASRASQYLNSLRPSTDKPGILDDERVPSKAEVAQYHRALSVAESPLIVLHHINEGTLLPQDVVTLKTIYPTAYEKMSQKVVSEMTEQVAKGKSIPYVKRLGLSMLLAQPLDSTMTPQFIQASMASGALNNNQNTQQPSVMQKGSKQALNKMPGMYQTVSEARAAKRSTV
jgi:hypothetical protein